MMELDAHSPFSDMHSCSSKRPRSPDSPVGRTPKRPSIAADALNSSAYGYSAFRSLRQDGRPGSSARQTSDDWVQQASGLTINTPAILARQSRQQSPGKVQMMTDEGMDEYMATDEKDVQGSYFPPVSLPLLRIPNKISLPPAQHEPSAPAEGQQLQLAEVSSTRLYGPRSTLLSNHLLAPTIVVHPSTPAESPVQDSSLQNATDSYPSPASMQASPLSPWSKNGMSSPNTPRKQRVTMGPRSDCEKCQQGVKGHWMHLD